MLFLVVTTSTFSLSTWNAFLDRIVRLQKAAIDVAPHTPTRPLPSADKQEVSVLCSCEKASISILSIQTIESSELRPKELAPPSRHERQRSFGRGDLDEALRTLKDGQTRRKRSTPSSVRVHVNKVFVDGRQDGRTESRAATP
jgi:hypothetical protein